VVDRAPPAGDVGRDPCTVVAITAQPADVSWRARGLLCYSSSSATLHVRTVPCGPCRQRLQGQVLTVVAGPGGCAHAAAREAIAIQAAGSVGRAWPGREQGVPGRRRRRRRDRARGRRRLLRPPPVGSPPWVGLCSAREVLVAEELARCEARVDGEAGAAGVGAAPRPTRVRCVSILLDKNRRYIGKSQSKRPPKRTQRTPHRACASWLASEPLSRCPASPGPHCGGGAAWWSLAQKPG
jgi:hypothetical protein